MHVSRGFTYRQTSRSWFNSRFVAAALGKEPSRLASLAESVYYEASILGECIPVDHIAELSRQYVQPVDWDGTTIHWRFAGRPDDISMRSLDSLG
jgi:hypothetical protein